MVKSVDEALVGAHARAAAAEQRLRIQTLVRAEAEHRLKTSLAVISGWAATLDERWAQLSETRRREAVRVIRRVSDELAGQAQGLLEDARGELLSLNDEPVRLDLGAVLGVTSGMFGGMGGPVVEAVAPQEPVIVEVDPAALQQVVGHLLENAVKYSPKGTRVVVSVAASGADALIEVRDEGRGIPEGVDLFEPFRRGPGTDDLPGVGLGLSIVRNLVRSMGGEVTARNNDGTGATFSVRLPAVPKGSKDPGVVDPGSPNMGPCRTSGTGTTSRS